jgi:hypothetical protein
MLTVPLLAGMTAMLLLLGLHWADSHGSGHAGLSRLTTIMAGLVMVYYVPGLGQIAVLAHRRATSIPAYWTRMMMLRVWGAVMNPSLTSGVSETEPACDHGHHSLSTLAMLPSAIPC